MTMIQKFVEFDMNAFVRGGAPVIENYLKNNDEYAGLLRKNICPITVNDKSNQQLLTQIMDNVKHIPQIMFPALELNTEPFTAEYVKTEKDDTNDIKKEIRKINKKCACHECDHTRFEKLKCQYIADISNLRKSKNLKTVNDYYNSMAGACDWLNVKETDDKVKKNFHKKYWEYDDDVYHSVHRMDDLEKVQRAAIDFNQEVAAIKAKYCATHCTKCEKLKKEYEYTLNLIQDMRDEEKERREEEIKQVLDEIENPPIINFMNQYFNGKDRIKVSDITRLWKTVNKKMIKQDEIIDMLEETNEWKITNSHNIKYATKQTK